MQLLRQPNGLLSVTGLADHAEILGIEHLRQGSPQDRLVLDDQDSRPPLAGVTRGVLRRRCHGLIHGSGHGFGHRRAPNRSRPESGRPRQAMSRWATAAPE